MSLYYACVALHLVALSLWLGHMFVWSLIVGPAMKKIQPAETAALLRERSQYRGGLGWPALAVLVPTGLYMAEHRGLGLGEMLSGAAFTGPEGTVFAVKLLGVAAMIGYQAVFAHRSAPIAVYFNMLVAIVIIAASVLLVRGFA
jgi:uncharacterized membrane protein